MKTLSKNTFRFLSIASMSMLLVFSLSCKKDETVPNGSDTEPKQPLIASADIEISPSGEVDKLMCYNFKNNTEVLIYDTIMQLNFTSTDEYGKGIDGPNITIMISNPNGFHEGDVYIFSGEDNPYAKIHHDEAEVFVNNVSSGELRINSIGGTHIKGTFEFTGKDWFDPTIEVVVSNGKFESNTAEIN